MAEKREIGKDLRLRFNELGADLTITERGDLDTVENYDDLAQAIIVRLSTDEGELYDIGHVDFGSHLYEVVGELNNEATRKRVQSIIRECLFQEPRIQEVVSVNVLTDQKDPHRLDIEITVLPINSKTYLSLTYPFRLEG
jgi:phage baseplate assembly protein W